MDIERYRQELIAKEQKLLEVLNRTASTGREHQPEGSDAGDQSVFAQEKEFLFSQADFNRKLLAEVREALQRIEKQTYGECAADGEPIASPRLDAIPWARYCIHHQSIFDELSIPA